MSRNRLGVCLLITVCLMLNGVADVIHADEEPQIPNCGTANKKADAWQETYRGMLINKITEYFETSITLNNGCLYTVRAEGRFVDVSDSATASAWTQPVAGTRKTVVPPAVGTYNADGVHWYRYLQVGGTEVSLGLSHAQVQMQSPDAEDEAAVDALLDCGGPCGGDPQILGDPNGSPIIFDLDRNGFQLTGPDDRVTFDLDADGIAELTNWTARGSRNAFLALDRNGNGRIDSGAELFGNHTPAYFDDPTVASANGFEALRFLESPRNGVSDHNNEIAAADSMFSRLLIWIDRNHNGRSEPNELAPAARAGLVSISLDYKESKRRDQYGNELKQVSDSTWLLDDRLVHVKAVDVWFASTASSTKRTSRR